MTFVEVVNVALLKCHEYRLRSQEGKNFGDSSSSSKFGRESASNESAQKEFAGKCLFCKEIGHKKRDCPQRGKGPRFEEILEVQPLQQIQGRFRPGDYVWEPIDEDGQSD